MNSCFYLILYLIGIYGTVISLRVFVMWYTRVLYFDPRPGPKVLFQGDAAGSRRRSRGRIGACDVGRGEGPILPLRSCTGGEWPLNCMTVVSA